MSALQATTEGSSAKPAPLKCGTLVIKRTIIIPRTSVAKGGPVPALLRRGRWPLATWLLLIATANPKDAVTDLRAFQSFARSLGLAAGLEPSSVRGKMTRIIAALEELKLVKVVGRRYRHYAVQLRSLDGSGGEYVMPDRGTTKVVDVPGELLANGWHARLTAAELTALLIALTEASYQFRSEAPIANQWKKRRWHIHRDYGLAESTWSKGADGLFKKGLLDWESTENVMPFVGEEAEHVPWSLYTVHPEVLKLKPDEAPTYLAGLFPASVQIAGGRKLWVPQRYRIPVPSATEPNQPPTKGGSRAPSATST